jgi:methionyl-tRNA synthetase
MAPYFFPPFFYNQRLDSAPFLWCGLILLLLWHIVWKGLALWRSARNHQKGWFITLLIVNTLGLLEILYLCCFQKPKSKSKTKRQSK